MMPARLLSPPRLLLATVQAFRSPENFLEFHGPSPFGRRLRSGHHGQASGGQRTVRRRHRGTIVALCLGGAPKADDPNKLAAEIVATATENGPRQEQDATRPGKKSSKRKKKPSPKS
jgi:hypothetical protein